MERKDLDWRNIGFSYMPMDKHHVANYKDGAQDEGGMISDPNVVINECVDVLQYCQGIFEGLKAYTTEGGSIVTSRPNLNAGHVMDSTRRLEMPLFPKERFLEAVGQMVKANAARASPFGSGAALYLGPYIFVTGPVIDAKPPQKYQFGLFGTPAGPYLKGGAKPLTFYASNSDRATPNGTGHVRAGLNYAISLHASVTAHVAGHDENVFLDPGTRTYIEETGGANFLFVTKDGGAVTPKSDSILPSITRRSLMYVTEHCLGLRVTRRPMKLSELDGFTECGLCGMATVISPVDRIVDHEKEICFPSGMDAMRPATKKLYDTLADVQMGTTEVPEGWIRRII